MNILNIKKHIYLLQMYIYLKKLLKVTLFHISYFLLNFLKCEFLSKYIFCKNSGTCQLVQGADSIAPEDMPPLFSAHAQ